MDKAARDNPEDSSLYDETTEKMLEDYDLFETLHDQYGWTPENFEPNCSIEKLDDLTEKPEKEM